ncbi:hypothetical protein [Pantoea agglomerans]
MSNMFNFSLPYQMNISVIMGDHVVHPVFFSFSQHSTNLECLHISVCVDSVFYAVHYYTDLTSSGLLSNEGKFYIEKDSIDYDILFQLSTVHPFTDEVLKQLLSIVYENIPEG